MDFSISLLSERSLLKRNHPFLFLRRRVDSIERSHWQKLIYLPSDWSNGHEELSQLRRLRPLPQSWVLTGKHCPHSPHTPDCNGCREINDCVRASGTKCSVMLPWTEPVFSVGFFHTKTKSKKEQHVRTCRVSWLPFLI